MLARVAVVDGLAPEVRASVTADSTVCLDWSSPARNCQFAIGALEAAAGPVSAVVRDLLDVAAAVYLADLAVPRGRNEEFVRSLEIHMPVRCPDAWAAATDDLARLVYLLTGDNVVLTFHPRDAEDSSRAAPPSFQPDSVCLLSGGLDSLAGAVALLRTGRQPLFVSHRSGNPTSAWAQRNAAGSLRKISSGFAHVQVSLMPRPAPGAMIFPPPEEREFSRRARSLVFLALGAAAAAGLGTAEVYLCENGVLTAALPFAPSRTGALSTRSTHPAVLDLFNSVCRRLGLTAPVLNPFLYRTKADILRDILRPNLSIDDIQATVSCWMTGRRHRPCGGCVPCLVRRVSMLAAGLPDEAAEIDLLASPSAYRGTDAYVNLVDLLGYVAGLRSRDELQLLLQTPALLDLQPYGVSVPDVVAVLKRFGDEVAGVVEARFPAAARLLADVSASA
jgi:7-cyano-7-deazaguanine synthase in queuosine biosynthesis